MLKLEQLDVIEPQTLIAEILEPIVYTHVGSVHKTDEIIASEKQRAPYLVAKVVKGTIATFEEPNGDKLLITYKVGDHIVIPRHAMSPITFPIEGYDSPKLAAINAHSIFAKITEEELPVQVN